MANAVISGEPKLFEDPESLIGGYRKKMGENIDLTKAQESRLKGWLKKRIDEWKEDTQELQENLVWDNDLVEGIVQDTNFPFEGASNAHIPLTETYMDVYRSVLKRSILGADLIWSAQIQPGVSDEVAEMGADIESMMNYLSRNEWNVEDAIKNILWATQRDGLAAMQVTWAEEFEESEDILFITNVREFLAEFPNPDDAGVTPEQFQELIRFVQTNASDEFPIEIPITFEKHTYNGCKAEIVERVDFVTFPAVIPHISHQNCRGYGKRFRLRKGVIKQMIEDEILREKEAKALIKDRSSSNWDEFREAQADIEGLDRKNRDDEYEIFELVIKGKIDGAKSKGPEKKYMVKYSHDRDKLIQITKYVYRVDFYALFKIDSRPNRMEGRSIPQKTRDLNDIVDTQYNQRINSRTISSVPTFKALNSKKKQLDPVLRQNQWGPGRIFWVDDFDSFDQFKIQPTDLGESMQEEQNARNILDLYLGAAVSLLSGQAPSQDPDAPGNKTAMLINQSNLRMEDPLDEIRSGVEEVGDICLSHLYQFGPPIIDFMAAEEVDGAQVYQPRTLHKKYLRTGLKMKMNGVTVRMNAETEMQNAMNLHTTLLQAEPFYAQNGMIRVNGLRRALRKGRVADRDRLLPPAQEIERMEIQLRKKAMLEIEAEKAQMAKEQQAEKVKGALQTVKTARNVRQEAEQLSLQGLGLNGSQEN